MENELAQIIIDLVPSIEKVRMTSSGTEAHSQRSGLRGAHREELIIKFDGCYHGHVDSLLVNAGSGVLTFGLLPVKAFLRAWYQTHWPYRLTTQTFWWKP